MKLKSFAELSATSESKPALPKFHKDILRFGESQMAARYTRSLLLKEIPDAITEISFSSEKGYRLLIEVIYGKAEVYTNFLKQYNLFERSMRTEIEEMRKIGGK